jgi:hypothetical protein
MKSDIISILKVKGNKAAGEAAKFAMNDGVLLQQLFEGAGSSNKRVKNAAAKALRIISETEPAKLYSKFDFFFKLMNGEDTILKWIAIDIIGNLSSVDRQNKINKKVLRKFFALRDDEVMITAAHSIDNLWKIALRKPRYANDITSKLLKEDAVERSADCRNILAGKTIATLSEYFAIIPDQAPVLAYAKGHLNNSRNGTRKKAEEFLKRFQKR